MRSRFVKGAFGLITFVVFPALVACEKKTALESADAFFEASVDSSPDAVKHGDTGAEISADADAASDADAGDANASDANAKVDAARKLPIETNLRRLKECCAALHIQSKALGRSPEAKVLSNAADECEQMVAKGNVAGNVPELNLLRTAVHGRPIPLICSGF